MKTRSRTSRIVMIVIPTILLVLAAGIGEAQTSRNSDLFSPVYQIYQYIQSYFYQPEQIGDQRALYGAMKGVVQQLGDPYSEFLDPEDRRRLNQSVAKGVGSVGIELTISDGILTVITPMIGTPAETAGIVAGDLILAIDGDSTEGVSLSEAAYLISGDIGSEVVLTVRHEDREIVDIAISRAIIEIADVEASLRDDGRIGYLRLYRYDPGTTQELDEALAWLDPEGLTGLILDMRNNPGGLLNEAIDIASRFIDEGTVLITSERGSGERTYASSGNDVPNLPLAILINRGTASASEITAAAIRDNDMGVLVGETSYGKGVFQQLIDFLDGSVLKLTTGEYFTPDGAVVNGVGLTPDIVASEGEDPIDLAIAWIRAHEGIEMPIDLDAEFPKAPTEPGTAP